MLEIKIVSETAFVTKGQGVHTAFIEHVKLMREKSDVKVFVNREVGGDIFHCHTYGPYYFWMGRKYKGKRVHTAHVIPASIKGSLPFWKQLLPLVRWYFKTVYTYADVVIALSPTVEQAIKELGVKTKIIKIYNPVFPDFWKRTEEKRKQGRRVLKLSSTEPVILGVGQLQGRKGVETFIEIAEYFPETKFIWVGGRPFGALTEGIRRINKQIEKAPANVHFVGLFDISDMPNLYAAADIFFFPSYQENCPLSPIEAAASGMPVVFRDIQEYTKLYNSPYLKGKTKAEFVNLIKKLLNDSEFYSRSQKLSENLVKQFDKDQIRNQLINLYQELAKEKNKTQDDV